ncbi:hypothetical protein E3T26_14285 [Cryobacterium sp. TMT1-21]|uniref:hypothetical protein n=1 Tax=unclassified Cryobacterium TaxID=2649013 RepID=UPI00106907A7|nr:MULTISPECIES: hypothetical protein [unclassified Cryobacterium]TFC87703.1 hypothetical protein E3T24_04410 [Cryobacterium sp. TmT2-59]TFD10114.1 hypothetical protein E3T26_14285 [Cryobacterium sp. TMT1-21]TFD20714.1 hypothetical protein E3T32_08400 [Cryobacterium sp. TMT2-23]TFD22057.1 hypothetical protein E3T42_00315 [Cryobacterium sp. TMT4-10]TFD39179.1 hypothetical protein E3T37_08540 [Cryobacterium sp. TMT2-10]
MSTAFRSTAIRSTASPVTITASPAVPSFRGLVLVPVRSGLWRVIGRSGAVLGHIERRTDADGDRFAARRLIAATRSSDLGTFWRIDDAADCFR